MSNRHPVLTDAIQKRIYTIRGLQVMLDQELAHLYGVETKRLNEQVKRNIERFPSEFMFQLAESDMENLRSQFATLNDDSLRSQSVTLKNVRGQHRKYLPYVFTEQGVAMLSAVLKSETAVKVSIQIMSAFVAMRRFLQTNAQVFQRLDTLELKQNQTDQKVERVLNALDEKSTLPKQGIFYDGQVFDAWHFVSDLIRSASRSIILIDNYIDDSTLSLFTKCKPKVSIILCTKTISNKLEHDVKKYNAQYAPILLKQFSAAHDRFLILDEKSVYHIGASLKDLGKKWFAFSKLHINSVDILEKLKK
jgi:phage regulator Rha-like protein